MLWKLNGESSLVFPVIEAPLATCFKEAMYARTGPPEYPILSKSIANSSGKPHSNGRRLRIIDTCTTISTAYNGWTSTFSLGAKHISISCMSILKKIYGEPSVSFLKHIKLSRKCKRLRQFRACLGDSVGRWPSIYTKCPFTRSSCCSSTSNWSSLPSSTSGPALSPPSLLTISPTFYHIIKSHIQGSHEVFRPINQQLKDQSVGKYKIVMSIC